MSNLVNDLIETLVEVDQTEVTRKIIKRIINGLSDGSATSANIFCLLATVVKVDSHNFSKDIEVLLNSLIKQNTWLSGLKKEEIERFVNLVVLKTYVVNVLDAHIIDVLRPFTEVAIKAIDKAPIKDIAHTQRSIVQNLIGFGDNITKNSINKQSLSDVFPAPIVEILTDSQQDALLDTLEKSIVLKLAATEISQNDQVFLTNLIQKFVDKGNIKGLEILLVEIGKENFDFGSKLKALDPENGKKITHALGSIFNMPKGSTEMKRRVAVILAKIPEFTFDMFKEKPEVLRPFLDNIR